MEIKIAHVRDHYEVRVDGKFYCSADTFLEAAREAELCEQRKANQLDRRVS